MYLPCMFPPPNAWIYHCSASENPLLDINPCTTSLHEVDMRTCETILRYWLWGSTTNEVMTPCTNCSVIFMRPPRRQTWAWGETKLLYPETFQHFSHVIYINICAISQSVTRLPSVHFSMMAWYLEGLRSWVEDHVTEGQTDLTKVAS